MKVITYYFKPSKAQHLGIHVADRGKARGGQGKGKAHRQTRTCTNTHMMGEEFETNIKKKIQHQGRKGRGEGEKEQGKPKQGQGKHMKGVGCWERKERDTHTERKLCRSFSLVANDGQENVPDETDAIPKQNTITRRHQVEVYQLGQRPQLPRGLQGGQDILLETIWDILWVSMNNTHVCEEKRVDESRKQSLVGEKLQ